MHPSVWIKPVGSGDRRLPPNWTIARPDVLVNIGYPRHPRQVRESDFLAYYGSGYLRLPGIVIVETDPYLAKRGDEHYDRDYPWRTWVRALRIVPDMTDAPHLDTLSIERNMRLVVRQCSHAALSEREIDALSDLFGRAVFDATLAALAAA